MPTLALQCLRQGTGGQTDGRVTGPGGEPARGYRVLLGERRQGCGEQQFRAARQCGVQLPASPDQQLVPGARGVHGDGSQPPGHRSDPADRQRVADHPRGQRMAESKRRAVRAEHGGDPAGTFGGCDGVAVDQRLQDRSCQGVAEGHQLYGRPGGTV